MNVMLQDPSVELLDSMGSDLSVVNAARVSFAKESEWDYNEESGDALSIRDRKLISYLGTHGHWSPFAHTSLTFRISAPIFVARQLVKHQVGGVWNEVSRRYVDDPPAFYLPKVWRGKPENAKQGSSGVVDISNIDIALLQESVLDYYIALLKAGVAPEQARMVLPQNTMTEWWWTGSLMFFARVCKQRLDPHAQEETRCIAQLINDNIPSKYEHSWKALMYE
jgi:thymidylate synthase (FAD)